MNTDMLRCTSIGRHTVNESNNPARSSYSCMFIVISASLPIVSCGKASLKQCGCGTISSYIAAVLFHFRTLFRSVDLFHTMACL